MSFRWGVAGPGGIAARFADAMTTVDDGDIVAVASRSASRADAYGDRFGIARRYGDYAGLAEDRDVDIVYVATPQSRHVDDALLYIEAGKHVLCEKPLALNARQAQQMVDAAHAAGVFLMEAIWSRFLPSYVALGHLLADGRIGEPLFVEADFGFRTAVDPAARHFDLALGGGGLLDLGIYPVQLSTLVLGLPDRISADGVIGATGVDEQVAAVLHHPGDRMSVVKAALRVPMACTARIAGTDGWIGLPAFMHCPTWLDVGALGTVDRIDAPYEGDGLRFEVLEVHRCLNEGLRESPGMSLAESVAIAGILDTIRAQIGLVFPGD